LPLWVRPQDSLCNTPIHLGGLHNKHGYDRDEHRCRGKGYDDPAQAGTGLTLHEFVGGLPTMLYISPSGKIVHTVSGVIPRLSCSNISRTLLPLTEAGRRWSADWFSPWEAIQHLAS
jgi:hypothetical protein